MRVLLAKELRELRPISILFMALVFFGYFLMPFFERLDELTFYGLCASACDPGIDYFSGWLFLLLILAIAYSLFPREVDSKTIDYVMALPVTFSQIFLAKFVAAILLVLSFELFAYALGFIAISFNPDSVDGGYYHAIEWRYLILMASYLFVVLSHGIFISWFRMSGLILYALVLLFVTWLELAQRHSSPFNVFELLRFSYFGDELQLPVEAMLVQIPVAGMFLFAGYLLWSRGIQRRTFSGRIAQLGRSLAAGLPALAVLLVLIVSSVVLAWRFNQQSDGNYAPTLRSESAHYVFFSGPDKSAVTDQLLLTADPDHRTIASMLETEASPYIIVDGTRTSSHYAGTAGWKRIRLDLTFGQNASERRRVLAHETVHVFQSSLSAGKLSKHHNSLKFYIEGMADYLSFNVVPEAVEAREWSRRVASIAEQRQRIGFDVLSDSDQFSQNHANEYFYSLGEVWAAAMVEQCGESVHGNVLRYLASDKQLRKLSGIAWWQSLLQQLDCDYGLVLQAWKNRLAETRQGIIESGLIDKFPRLELAGFRFDSDGDKAVDDNRGNAKVLYRVKYSQPLVEPSADLFKLSQSVVLRLRQHADDNYESITVVPGREDNGQLVFSLPSSDWTGSRVSLQVGYQPAALSPVYYQAWQNAVIR